MTTVATVSAPGARAPAIDRAAARSLMVTEYQRVAEQLRTLTVEEWRLPTCNTGWDVLALAKHMLGMVAMASSLREQVRQMRGAKRRGGEFIDALTALQVDTYDGWTPERISREFERLAPKAVKNRMRTPGFVQRRTMPDAQPVDPPRVYEAWTFGYLIDVILTRDPWMHRADIAAATGRALVLTEAHDGRIVGDVASEWAQRHGQPCRLSLTGPLARDFVFGTGAGPTYTVDAVEFCRIVSGRGHGDGLLLTRVPF